jgi:nucleoid-associated protein YgaU
MASEKIWQFQQLAGPKSKLILSGWSAPHGRPYHGPVASDGVNIRHKSTRYPGNSGPPTRHIMGYNYSDIELHGRFRDRELGQGGALDKVLEVKKFVKDLQTCDISWGDIIHITGVISEFVPGRESDAEVVWTMKILVDKDNISSDGRVAFNVPSLSALMSGLAASLDAMQFLAGAKLNVPGVGGIRVNILDQLDDLVSVVTGTVGQLVNIANTIGNFENAVANDAKRLIAGVHQARTAILNFTHTLSSAKQDELFIRDSAQDTIVFNNASSAAYTQADIALALLSDTENLATVRLKGFSKNVVRAKEGDTFESLSIRYFGGPAEANKIREANGIKYGRKPHPGETIIIPVV